MSFFTRQKRGKDLYKMLDVSRDASDKEIKAAFL
jgi:DnaJ-class molecular chaperone